MNLTEERLKELDSPSLTEDERALLRCRAASELIHGGQHDDAREALGELWRGLGERPDVKGLGESTAAEVLLQVGALSGWIGASRQVAGAQAAAKDLVSESAALFERLGQTSRAAFARSDLALCYWREGAYDEARVLYVRAFEELDDTEQRATVLLRRLTVEYSAKRYDDALFLLRQHSHLFDEGVSHVLRGSFHNHLALVLRHLGSVEGRAEYFDQAIIEYTAAIYHYEQARHERYLATNENNLAFLLYKLGRHADAHQHLDRAQAVLTRLKDLGMLAQVDETRARVLLAERRYREADRTLAGVLKSSEQGDESALLADAFTLQGVVWARLCAYENSVNILRRAADVAETVGALSNAGQAMLSLIEEHGASRRLTPAEVYAAYQRANRLLKDTQDAEDLTRLRACALIVMRRLADPAIHEKNFSLYGAVQDLEAKLIGQALEASGGSVTQAARLLGLTHQTLNSMLEGRHRRLQEKRTPAKKRLKSIIKK
ncbi:MAG TPA: helix-turn-helix domain-containing protein [Pyrinomonadaceae bacterium]|nr:helix-turn-helix domain-containing protein [Pyrinomonadaceae bacterium]